MKHKSILISLLIMGCLIGGAAFDLGIVRASATFVVDSTGDEPDNNLADNLCHTAADTCTLRAAIQQANAISGADTIDFNIPGIGVHTITPAIALPIITDPVTIDGYSQPGASLNTQATGDDAVLLIELAGNDVSGGVSGLFITAGSSTVRGLVINRWLNSAIDIRTNGNNTIVGNFIGTDATGAAASFSPSLNNGSGVSILSASDNSIGGITPAAGSSSPARRRPGRWCKETRSAPTRRAPPTLGMPSRA
jgi:CSLREA domain-containing protein